jgi:GTP pyrophosphokinase
VTTLTPRFDEALTYAREHHAQDIRKGTSTPYLSHLLAVSSLVLDMEGSEDEAIAALLHDVVEDGGGQPAADEIRERWGDDVARIVLACSDSISEDRAQKAPWHDREEQYLAQIATKRPDELRVSLADKLHNSRAILFDLRAHGDGIWTRFKTGRDGQLWYYGELARAFDGQRDRVGQAAVPAVDELRRVVDDITALANDPAAGR